MSETTVGFRPEAISAGEWRQIVQSATETAIITTDHEGRVTSWSEGARQILGWTEEEMLGRSLDCLFSDPDQLRRELRDAAANGRGGGEEGWRLRKDGSVVWAAGEMHPIHGEDGRITGCV
jgi:PAS domain S-box-containing protein